jgi:O-antigen/teichoic acid export membrane protein
MISREQLFHGAFWSAVQTWGARVTTFIVFLVLARLLPAKDIGALALINTILLFAQTFAEGGLAEYLVQKEDQDKREQNSIFWTQLAMGVLLAVVLLACGATWGTQWIAHPDASLIVAVICATVPLITMSRVPEALIRHSLEFRSLAIRSLVSATTGGIVGIVLAYAGYGLWSLVIKQAVESGMDLLMLFFLSPWRPSHPNFRHLRNAARYGVALLGSRMLDVFNQRLDTLVVGYLLGPAALGVFTVGQRIYATLLEMFVALAFRISVPFLAKVKIDPKKSKTMQIQFIRATSLVVAPIFALLAVLAPSLLPWLFGPKWEHSIPLLQWLCLAGPIVGISTFNSAVLLANGASNLFFRIVVIITFVSAIALPVGAMLGGLVGVAMAYVLRICLMLPIGHQMAKRFTNARFRELLVAAWPGFACAAMSALAAQLALLATTPMAPPFRLAMAGSVALAALAASGRVFFPGAWALVRTTFRKKYQE